MEATKRYLFGLLQVGSGGHEEVPVRARQRGALVHLLRPVVDAVVGPVQRHDHQRARLHFLLPHPLLQVLVNAAQVFALLAGQLAFLHGWEAGQQELMQLPLPKGRQTRRQRRAFCKAFAQSSDEDPAPCLRQEVLRGAELCEPPHKAWAALLQDPQDFVQEALRGALLLLGDAHHILYDGELELPHRGQGDDHAQHTPARRLARQAGHCGFPPSSMEGTAVR